MTLTLAAQTPTTPIPLPRRRGWQSADRLVETVDCRQGALSLWYGDAARPPSITRHPRVMAPSGGDATRGPTAWAAAFVQAVVEVIASDRPVTQLVRWTSHRVYNEIVARQRIASARMAAGQRGPRHQIATVHICQPSADAIEVAARVTSGGRSRALAARLDYRGARWTCTALMFG